MAIQIGAYKRPGIYINEIDKSTILSPIVTGTNNLVIGFSKKGPVNTPVLLNNTNDLLNIFGSIDRQLERKGCFFHRTIAKMLESGPVYAVNLLSTSDTLDTIEYKSLSTATDKVNDIIRDGAYRRFFDTTGFWKKSTDAFNTLTSNDPDNMNRLLSFTNLSDKYITTFIFKSKVTGYNRTMLQWYGNANNIPPYVNQLDYVSDYLVDILVVSGDWSNYQQLSVDAQWSSYFNSSGLMKAQVDNFANDNNVNVLSYYQGLSLIPYFRDVNNRNIFVETVINQDTDKTGLFCAVDIDKLESDYPNGMIDLIGNNLVGENNLIDNGQTTIDFLSYNATITESLTFNRTPLDIAGGSNGQNVFAMGPSMSTFNNIPWDWDTRTAYYREGYLDQIKMANTSGLNVATPAAYTYAVTSTQSVTVGFTIATSSNYKSLSPTPYAVIGGQKIDINSGLTGSFTYSISPSSYPLLSATATYVSVYYLDGTTGNISVKNGTTNGQIPTLNSNDLPLGYANWLVKDGSFLTASYYTPVYSDANTDGFRDLAIGTSSTADFYVTDLGNGEIRVTFPNTANTNTSTNYKAFRRVKMFNALVNLLDSNNLQYVTMIKDVVTKEKFSLANASISNIVTSTTSNRSFDLNLGLPSTPTDIANGNLIFYKLDNEFVFGSESLETIDTLNVTTNGIVAKYSDLYLDFYNGNINTEDYFYRNFTDKTIGVIFQNYNGDGYITFSENPFGTAGTPTWYSGFNGDETFIVNGSTLNTSPVQLDGYATYSLPDIVSGTGTYSYSPTGTQSYKLTAQVEQEILSNVSEIWDANNKVYLQMYLDDSSNLTVKFLDSTLSSPIVIDPKFDKFMKVTSNKSNYKQTIEIVEPTGYTPVTNKILVNSTRYSEVKIGDFLEAYVDTNTIEVGQVARKLTRIIKKTTYAADTTLSEITCDAAIQKNLYGGTLQTNRYTSIDDYVSVYKAIPLKGFKMRQDSMPDGTESRQNSILNLVAKGTPLFKSLTNKESFDFRYLIDSFGLGLIERSKQQLVDICGQRLDCFGFINMPSIKSFKNSSSPSFVNSEGVIQTSFIATGGDLDSSPAFLYSFGDGKGVSTVGYFLPYVTVNDNGRPIDVPPAAYVATTYMRKINGATTAITPWTIAAGITNGRITNIAGLEMDFDGDDIANLNTAMINPIVYKKSRGWVIETENTAQTLYKSALSYIHVREVLIELERELAAMLLDFQWRFNTAEVRAEIKLKADIICEKYVNKDGLYNYFNKCDEENNTSEIIDNQIGVLDTYVEPIRGMGIIVNNVTILRTGAIASGGFMTI